MVRRADNVTGLKQDTDDANFIRKNKVVGEHFECAEARSERTRGAFRRENVGMSNPLVR